MGAFFEMGGYGAFIWSAYGIGGVVLVALAVRSYRAMRQNEATAKRLRASVRGEDGESDG